MKKNEDFQYLKRLLNSGQDKSVFVETIKEFVLLPSSYALNRKVATVPARHISRHARPSNSVFILVESRSCQPQSASDVTDRAHRIARAPTVVSVPTSGRRALQRRMQVAKLRCYWRNGSSQSGRAGLIAGGRSGRRRAVRYAGSSTQGTARRPLHITSMPRVARHRGPYRLPTQNRGVPGSRPSATGPTPHSYWESLQCV